MRKTLNQPATHQHPVVLTFHSNFQPFERFRVAIVTTAGTMVHWYTALHRRAVTIYRRVGAMP